MLIETGYDRRRAVSYALRWALSRNPEFYDFDNIGGDCTNFVSQCLYAGCRVMNYSGDEGWYYIDLNNRAPAWTGVEFLNRFLLNNEGPAVYGELMELSQLRPGDVIQLRNSEGRLYHTMIVSFNFYPGTPDRIFICSHTNDARNRRLSSYNYAEAVGIHIAGARREIF
ncbi:MAG: amidase domain-containing protein [Oscillospiraceae bacterium]|nr:amidase domain-containing protein [Oscillospiraceae bacterium]